jgi:hypothetical protein
MKSTKYKVQVRESSIEDEKVFGEIEINWVYQSRSEVGLAPYFEPFGTRLSIYVKDRWGLADCPEYLSFVKRI